ncbi:MAG TPA: radical SAM protein [Campylobacterales bacterium]|nr:radical SAM protein [Campylobacterales bacterium]
MLRVSSLIKASIEGGIERRLNGAIAIWNVTNRCNLSCMHCYSKSTLESDDSLTLDDILNTLPSLVKSGVKFIIFSGGEPLTRSDIFDIADRCRELGIVTYLSTNGLYVKSNNVKKIADSFDYIGVSIDGDEETHDYFRGLKGSFGLSISAIKSLLSHSSRVGIRFTLTQKTKKDLPFIFELAEKLQIPKIYISHLVYSGRGLENQEMDISKRERYEATKFIIDKALEYYKDEVNIEIVTGNMEPDALLLYRVFEEAYPAAAEAMKERILAWGGNSAGRKLVNIDSKGNVKPDPFFPITIGNIKERSFDDIWNDAANETLLFLRKHPRSLNGYCRECEDIAICNGGSRARAFAVSGELDAEDPSCYRDEIIKKEQK